VSEAGAPSRSKVRLGGWHDIIRSGGVKFVALGISAVLGILITRIIITNFGTDVFAQYGLLIGLGALLPIGVLGVDAPIVNTVAVSEDVGNDRKLQDILVSSIRVLLVAGAVLLVVVLLMSIFGLWDALLGDGLLVTSGAIAAGLCMALWSIGMPFGIGSKVLAGLGKNYISIAVSGIQSPIVLVILLIALALGADRETGSYIPVVSYAATLLIGMIATIIAAKLVRPTLWQAIKRAPFPRRFSGAKILDQAWPMTIIMIALPVGMQTDRIVLSHVATSIDLAQYNLASQMYTPIFALVSAAGFTLWPRFAAARAKNQEESPRGLSLVFGAIAAAFCLGVSLIAGPLAEFASGGEVTLGIWLLVTFSAWMIIQAFQYPFGMYLTDKRGLRFQALMVSLMLPFNLGASWVLAERYGAVGPVIGSAIGVLFFQLIANLIFVRVRTRDSVPSAAATKG
jgi:O-antigen/teichoic acid export membrane protein